MRMSFISYIRDQNGTMKKKIGSFHFSHSILNRRIFSSRQSTPSKELNSKKMIEKSNLVKMEVVVIITHKRTNSENQIISNRKEQRSPNQRRDKMILA